MASAAAIALLRAHEAHEQVRGVVEDMVGDLEQWWHQQELHAVRTELARAQQQLDFLHAQDRQRVKSQQELEKQRVDERARAAELRLQLQTAAVELAAQLESRAKLADDLRRAQSALADKQALERKLVASERQLRELTRRHTLLGSTHAQFYDAPAAAPRPPPAASFAQLEDKVLLTMFSFLQAVDVLAGATMNKPFFRRVDVLFGMGVNLPERAPAAAAAAPAAAAPAAGPAAAAAAAAAAAPVASGIAKALSSALSGASPARAKSKAVSEEAGAELDEDGAPERITGLPGLEGIGGKLSSSEMRALGGVYARQRQLAQLSTTLQTEKEDLLARLEGAESVRDFLVDKLKDTETALKGSMDAAEQQRAQAASDHEVIAFLDRRTKELESEMQTLRGEAVAHEAAMLKQREDAGSQLRGMQQMVDYVKAQKEEADAQAKAQKKLLVKEVRTLRAQLTAAAEERDTATQQLQKLTASLETLQSLRPSS